MTQTPALRPFLPADVPVLAAIYRDSIEELTGEDYSPSQQQAWAEAADDEEAFGAELASALTLVATIDRSIVGFAALKENREIAMLYVHPAAAGQGVGRLLCDALERLAAARGAAALTAEASDTALPFFEARGYQPQRRGTVPVGDEWLGRTLVEKKLAPAAGGRA